MPRQSIHANGPENCRTLFAYGTTISAHAVWWPRRQSVPSELKWNGLSDRPFCLAWRFRANVLASRDANCAVGGQVCPVSAFMTDAQSPKAQISVCPLT